jgi:uncharacterized protein (TIRG00374 family)
MSSKRMWSCVACTIFLILFVLSVFLLAYLLRDVNWSLIRQTGPEVLVLVLGLTVLSTLVYVLLVYLLIRGSGYTTTLWMTYLVLTSSLSVNYITPVKAGLPLRIYLYNHFIRIPVAIGTTLVAVETLVGMLVPAFIAIVGIVALFPSLGPATPVLLIVLLLAGLLFVLRMPLERMQPYLKRLPLPQLTARLLHFIAGVQSGLRNLSLLVFLGVVILDLLMLGIQALRLWLVLSTFATPPSLLTILAVFTISVTAGNLSMIPMGLGVRDASLTLLLAQVGIPNEIALSAAVIQRLFSPGWPLMLGLISTNLLSIKEILQGFDKDSATGEDQL